MDAGRGVLDDEALSIINRFEGQGLGGLSGGVDAASDLVLADVAAAAATVLTQPGHENTTYAMTGPGALTRVEQLEAIGVALDRKLTFAEQTPDEFAAEMAQYGVGTDNVKMLLDYWSDTVDAPDVPHPPDHLTGRPARTLIEWAQDHLADLQ